MRRILFGTVCAVLWAAGAWAQTLVPERIGAGSSVMASISAGQTSIQVLPVQTVTVQAVTVQTVTGQTVTGQTVRGGAPAGQARVSALLRLGEEVHLRSYVQTGLASEGAVRIGADVTFWGFGTGSAQPTDTALRIGPLQNGPLLTGHGLEARYSLNFGADMAAFPSGVGQADADLRLRGGMSRVGPRARQTIGLTYHDADFSGQSAHHLVGSVAVDFNF